MSERVECLPVVHDELQKVTEWLLAILCFAVTLSQVHRATVLTLAQRMDRFGSHNNQYNFTFFVRTSVAICDAIVDKGNPDKINILRRYLKKIDDDRLRRALEAALEIKRAATRPRKLRSRDRKYLWHGLHSR
jgi:hypothetical protein